MRQLGTGIQVANPIDLTAAFPLDNRAVQATLADRNAMVFRYDGVECYVESEKTKYTFVLGHASSSLLDNANWVADYAGVDIVAPGTYTKVTVNSKGRVTAGTDAIPSDIVGLLDGDGKINADLMPAISIINTYVRNSQAEMLALDAQQGDVCIRTDENQSYILTNDSPELLGSWQALLTPIDGVTSITLAAPTGEFDITNPTITSSGTITLTWKAQTQNKIFASPTTSSGSPAFRLLDRSDIPSTIDANTTGTSANSTLWNGLTYAGSLGVANLFMAYDGTSWGNVTPTVARAALGISAATSNPAAFTAGRIPYTTGANTLADSANLTWDNTNRIMSFGGLSQAIRFANSGSTKTMDFGMLGFGDTSFTWKNITDNRVGMRLKMPVGTAGTSALGIGEFAGGIPTESQLYVYGGSLGANIDMRGNPALTDEANMDWEGADWDSNPNSIGISYFGSSYTAGGTFIGKTKVKMGIIRWQNVDNAVINTLNNTPIRFGINDIEIANINSAGFSYQSDFSSVNTSNPRWLIDQGRMESRIATGQTIGANTTGNAGSATSWGGKPANFDVYATGSLNWIAGLEQESVTLKPFNPSQVKAFLATSLQDVTSINSNSNYAISVSGASLSVTPSAPSTYMAYNSGVGAGFIEAFDYGVTNTGLPLVLNPNGGSVLIGTSTNDGVNKLQVNGSVKVSDRFTTVNGFKSVTELGMIGNFDEAGATDKVIWTIGNSWNSLSTMYGIGYQFNTKYGNTHAIVFRENGNVKSAIDLSGGNIFADSRVITGEGFQNISYVAGRNRIWSFNNADAYGLSYHQGSGSIYGTDGIGIHFGDPNAPQFNFVRNGNLQVASLTGTGDRVVMADSTGTLKTGTLTGYALLGSTNNFTAQQNYSQPLNSTSIFNVSDGGTNTSYMNATAFSTGAVSGTRLIANKDALIFSKGGTAQIRIEAASTASALTQTLQAQSGTIALTSDITSAVAAKANLNGGNTFSGIQTLINGSIQALAGFSDSGFLNTLKSNALSSNVDSWLPTYGGILATIPATTGSAPTPTSSGIKGQSMIVSGYRYDCINTDTWVRSAIETSW